MQAIVFLTSLILLLILTWMVVIDYYRGRHQLLSNRNLFLISIAFFQCLSAIVFILYGSAPRGTLISGMTYFRYSAGLILLVICFLAVYYWRRPVHWLARHIPTRSPSRTILPIALVLTVSILIGLESRFMILPLPGVLRTLALPVGRGLCCFSIVLLLWVWNENRLNPFAWMICPALILILMLSLLRGEFGRRAVLSGLLAIAWGMYFFRWQFKTAVLNTPKYAVWGLLILLLIGGVTAIRSREAETYSLAYRIRAVADAISLAQVRDLFYTDTYPNSIYCIERYTTDLDPQPFNSTLYAMAHPIPREIWSGKPDPLAEIAMRIVTVTEMKRYNWGPGIMGHAWHEGGFIFVIYFAIVFGLFFGAVDVRLMQQTTNPYFVAITGAALGQVIAMARGDIGFFTINWIFGMAGPIAIVYFVGLFSQNRADVVADDETWQAYEQWEDEHEAWDDEIQPAWNP